ncbi:hypothetical protein CapIbe_000404 [Capra ibex]
MPSVPPNISALNATVYLLWVIHWSVRIASVLTTSEPLTPLLHTGVPVVLQGLKPYTTAACLLWFRVHHVLVPLGLSTV